MTVYADYQRNRSTWLFGLSGAQAIVMGLAGLPFFISIAAGAWFAVFLSLVVWILLGLITVGTVRGRTVIGWSSAALLFSIGSLRGWTIFRPRAVRGAATDPNAVDLPGRLTAIEVLDGPPVGPDQTRIGLIKDTAAKTWAVTAAITHPGIGMLEGEDRDRIGGGLAQLLEHAARTELIAEVVFMVRTVPDDGAERALWVARHETDTENLARQVNRDLATWLTRASVRTEQYVTLIVGERELAKAARESGGGLAGRARILYSLMTEMEQQLRSGLAATAVTWMSSPELSAACRTGFAPGDRAGIIAALAARSSDAGVNAEVAWGMAGPAAAAASARYYAHDAWWSISSTITLPDRGAALGALAGVLMPGEPDERRSYMVAYPILGAVRSQRQAASQEWKADMAEGARAGVGKRANARTRSEETKSRNLDIRVARGRTITLPYAVATVTVPQTQPIADYGRRLDASIRSAGFGPLRLDLAHDLAFCASVLPLGVSLTRSTSSGLGALFEGKHRS